MWIYYIRPQYEIAIKNTEIDTLHSVDVIKLYNSDLVSKNRGLTIQHMTGGSTNRFKGTLSGTRYLHPYYMHFRMKIRNLR